MKIGKEKTLRVRFAPSPTGFLHVGGARTAIFNWLYARKKKGKFLLRIEDTDPERSRSELTGQILNSMKWLGMESDEPVVYQSDNIERYRDVIFQLVNEGKAYYAFETPEELTEKRKSGGLYIYDRAALNLSSDTIGQYLNEKRPYVIRFLVPDGITEFNDLVHGKTRFNNSEIEDFILLRSDGSPTYQIAVVVDDHDMEITHIIRGDDHLSNTPKQIMLYKALGWELPDFAHLPMILDEQKKKLSKRRNTVSIEEFKAQGYLPEAMFNFLTLLGFSPRSAMQNTGGENELFTRNELINLFSFDCVNKKPAVFDTKKLKWINFQYIQNSDPDLIIDLLKEYLEINNISYPDYKYLLRVLDLMKTRIDKIEDIVQNGIYFFKDPEKYDEKGIIKHWNESIKKPFKTYCNILQRYPDDFDAKEIEQQLRSFSESQNIKASQLIHLLRIMLTGGTASPGIFELMSLLGKNVVIKRIENFVRLN